MKNQLPYYVYVVRCNDDTYYTGCTQDLSDRLRRHNGKLRGGARYTSGRRPVTLVYSETFSTLAEASKREHEIKRMGRQQKEKLIENWKEGGRYRSN